MFFNLINLIYIYIIYICYTRTAELIIYGLVGQAYFAFQWTFRHEQIWEQLICWVKLVQEFIDCSAIHEVIDIGVRY